MSNQTMSCTTTNGQNNDTELYAEVRAASTHQGWRFKLKNDSEETRTKFKKQLTESTKALLEKMYDNNVVELSIEYTADDYSNWFIRLFETSHGLNIYRGEGNVSRVRKVLKREKRTGVIWGSCKNNSGDRRLVILMEYFDMDFIEKLRRNCYSWGYDVNVAFFPHSKIKHQQNKRQTIKRYHCEEDFCFATGFNSIPLCISAVIDRRYISYDKFLGVATGVLENNGFCFTKDFEAIPPNYDHLPAEEASEALRKWQEERNRKRYPELYKKIDEDRAAKEKKKAQKEADKKAKEEYRKANPIKDVVLNPFKQVGKDISRWFDSLYKK